MTNFQMTGQNCRKNLINCLSTHHVDLQGVETICRAKTHAMCNPIYIQFVHHIVLSVIS